MHYVLLVADIFIGVILTLALLAVSLYVVCLRHSLASAFAFTNPSEVILKCEMVPGSVSHWGEVSSVLYAAIVSYPVGLFANLRADPLPPGARRHSVLHHDPPDAILQQTHRSADGARCLHHSSPQVPGTAQPPVILEEEQRLLSAGGGRPACLFCFLFLNFCWEDGEVLSIYKVTVRSPPLMPTILNE